MEALALMRMMLTADVLFSNNRVRYGAAISLGNMAKKIGTHKAPRRNMPLRQILRPVESFRPQICGMGNSRMEKSIIM